MNDSSGTLLIDDQRTIPVDRTARTYAEGIQALGEKRWKTLYLDHDLGDFTGPGNRELTGYDVLCWLERNPEHLPEEIIIVSANPVGRQRMASVIAGLYRQAN